jgi:hypothetical protein
MSDVLDILRRRRERARRVIVSDGTGVNTKTMHARALEAQGYEAWLKKLGPKTFTKPFATFHHDFWGWYWPVRMKLLRGELLDPAEMAMLLMWFRGGGKSSHVEWACIAEGALGEGLTDEPGYVGYICDTETLAKGHVQSIRNRLDSAELVYHYPGLSNPRVDRHGYQTAWRQDFLATSSHWGIVPIGLEEGVRGGRLFDLRFTMFVFDDIDNRKDSPAGVEKKLKIIAHEILPAGTPETLKLFPQNLQHEYSALNQIYTRRSDVLSERQESGPVKAFDELELEPDLVHLGKWVIKRASPTWPGIDLRAARVFLGDSGRAAFLAEYQHEFDDDRSELVLKNWRDEVHVITWSQFEAVYKAREIPRRWNKFAGNDWATTKTRFHANVAALLAVASQNEPVPGVTFMYRPMSFRPGTQADDVALRLLKAISPAAAVGGVSYSWDELVESSLRRTNLERFISDVSRLIEARRDVLAGIIPSATSEMIARHNFTRFRMSHEAKAARDVYRRVYGLPFAGVNPGSDGGVEFLNNLTHVDRKRPHPFKADELGEGGLYRLGRSAFFLIVEDGEEVPLRALRPDALHDAALCRYQLARWRNVPAKLGPSGEVLPGPEKLNDDFGNLLMMQFHDGPLPSAPLTRAELVEEVTPEKYRYDALLAESPHAAGLEPHQEMTLVWNRQQAERKIVSGRQAFDEFGEPC